VGERVTGRLERRLGLGDAVVLGLGSMLGAGVFVAFAPAARAAGSGLLLGLAVAAAVAYCNAMSTARLAAAHPRAGGAYLYGRRRLGPSWGFVAGWGFVVGKTASCAAMALTVGAYAWPEHPRPVAVVVAAGMTAVNLRGITRTAGVTRVLVAATLLTLAAVVVGCLAGGAANPDRLLPLGGSGPYGLLQAGGLLFFAFAGYARIATLGEEVRDPARVIPVAVPAALGIVVVVYTAVGAAVLLVLGADRLGRSAAPLRDAVAAGDLAGLAPLVRVGAVAAAAGVLLTLLAGVGRTVLAMARDRELPGALDAVDPRFSVPHRAELAVGAAVVLLAGTVDLRGAIAFSGLGVLVYYAVANAAAWTLPVPRPAATRPVAAAGLAGCLLLAATLPPAGLLAGVATLAAGLLLRATARRVRRGPSAAG
jgi:APA family basic amino acid/polyamine antiporter